MRHGVAEPLQFRIGLGELLLDAAPPREVARDFAEADQRAGRVAHGRDDRVRPEPVAVLAQPPPFVLHPALARGRLELGLRLAQRHVFRRIEDGNVLAQNLFGGVALDRLGARIPARYPASGVEHENGVLLHALHQQAKPLLAFVQRQLRATALGYITRHLGEPDHRAVRVAQRRDDHVGPEAGAVLAHPPTLVFHAALAGGKREQTRRLARLHGVRRIETGEVLPDDLFRAVSLETLRARIPRKHPPRAIEHENGVVTHTLDQETETVRGLRGPSADGLPSRGHPGEGRLSIDSVQG